MRVANREIGERERWEEESYRYGDCRVGERGRRSILSGSKAFSEKPTISLFSVTPMSCSSCSRPPASPASPSAKTSNHFFFIYFDRYIRYLLFGIYPWTFLVAFTLLRFCWGVSKDFIQSLYLCSYAWIRPFGHFWFCFLVIFLRIRSSRRLFLYTYMPLSKDIPSTGVLLEKTKEVNW